MLNANVQKENDTGFSAGDISLEVNFHPLNVTLVTVNIWDPWWGIYDTEEHVASNTINIDYLRGRYFLRDDMALRMGILFNIDSEEKEGAGWYDLSLKNRVTDLGFYPGIERHFSVSERISPYFGGELGFFTRTTRSLEDSDVKKKIKNEDGYITIYLNILGGLDIYLYKGLYLGLELGYGLERKSFKDTEITIGGSTNIEENNDVILRLGDTVNTAIRLGFTF